MMNVMRADAWFAAMVMGCVALGADAPEFSAAGVTAPVLAPGAMLSIYGENLGPFPGWAAKPDADLRETVNPRNPDPQFAYLTVYPTHLCDTQVLIAGKPAGLLYVSPTQINFKVPQDSPETGMAELRVVSGTLSASISMPAGFGETTVSLAEPAYVGMPVWLKVDLRFRLGHIAYPSATGPADFGCDEVEVRRNGKLLPQLPGSNWGKYGGSHSGPVCGSISAPGADGWKDRLPLHLLYSFDTPGVYEVRYTMRNRFNRPPASQIRTQSEWTPIEILPSRPGQRKDFLEAQAGRAVADPGEILRDFLPGILGYADDASFNLLIPYLYDANRSVRMFAMDALGYWPEDFAATRLLALLHERGPSDLLVRFLLLQPEFGRTHQAEILLAAFPYLASDSAIAIDGALTAIQWPPGATGDPAVHRGLLSQAERILARDDVENRYNVLSDLVGPRGEPKDPQARALLLKLFNQGDHSAAQPLDKFGNPTNSPGGYLEQSLALQLMAIGEAEGFQYAARDLAAGGRLRTSMLESLKGQFADLRNKDDRAIAEFVSARAGN